MPLYDQGPEIAARGKNNPKLGERKYRRWPSGKPGYIGRKRSVGARNISTYGASIEKDGLTVVKVTLRNGTGHPMRFHIVGTTMPVFIGLDGNESYSTSFDHKPGDHVAVYVDNIDGELLATTEVDHG